MYTISLFFENAFSGVFHSNGARVRVTVHPGSSLGPVSGEHLVVVIEWVLCFEMS